MYLWYNYMTGPLSVPRSRTSKVMLVNRPPLHFRSGFLNALSEGWDCGIEILHKFILSDNNWWKRNSSLTLHKARPISFIHLMYLIKFMRQKDPWRNKIVNSWYLLVYPFNLNGISFFLSCGDFQLIHL